MSTDLEVRLYSELAAVIERAGIKDDKHIDAALEKVCSEAACHFEDHPLIAEAYKNRIEEEEAPAVCVMGNLGDGFTFVGPFNSWEDACELGDSREENTWIASMVTVAAMAEADKAGLERPK